MPGPNAFVTLGNMRWATGNARAFGFEGQSKFTISAHLISACSATSGEELTKRRGSSIFVEVDYSRWIRESVKDEYLAELVQQIEQNSNLGPQDTRSRICDAIEARYTLAE